MHSPSTPDDIADSTTSVVKKGYSIWSLLVVMTLLAVWLAVPRRLTNDRMAFTGQLFFVCHQLTLWMLIGVVLWAAFGKRKWVLFSNIAVIVLIWTPITISLAETILTGRLANTYCEQFFRSIGLIDHYSNIYRAIFTGLGYGPAI